MKAERLDTMTPQVTSEEETAKALGFENPVAFRLWRSRKERENGENLDWLIATVCNMLEQNKMLKNAIHDLERRLTDTGTERIG